MAKGVLWKGKYFQIPQAASKVDDTALNRTPLGGANRLVLIGEMVGLLEPKKAKKITNPSLGLELIHPSSPEARLAVKLAFDPSPGGDTPGASEVYLVPVNPATQATLALASAGAVTQATLTSHLYGLPANQVKVKVESGTTAGKKLTLAYGDDEEVFDNLYHNVFTIQYTGAGSAAAMTIDITAATHKLTTTVTDAAADNLDLDLNTYDTIDALVDAIEATGKYTVTSVTDQQTTFDSMKLDAVSAQDILTAPYTVTGNLQKLVDTLNERSGYVSAARAADAGDAPANTDWTYLAGGATGATANSDWQAAFDFLKTMDVDLIVPLTPDASLHTMGDTHCDYMSGFEGKSERRQFVGRALQTWTSENNRSTAITNLITEAKALNSDRTMHVGLGSKHYNEQGVATLYPGYLTACMYAGMAAGGSPVFPLTRKYLRCLGLEVDLRKGEIQQLLEAGVAVPIPDVVQNAGYVVSRQVTTHLKDNNLYRVEFSVGRGADYIAREVRRRHEEFIGEPGTEALDQTIVNVTNAVLRAAKIAGYIRDYDPKATQLRAEGTVRYIDYSAIPVLPINWIFSVYHLQPVSFTIEL